MSMIPSMENGTASQSKKETKHDRTSELSSGKTSHKSKHKRKHVDHRSGSEIQGRKSHLPRPVSSTPELQLKSLGQRSRERFGMLPSRSNSFEDKPQPSIQQSVPPGLALSLDDLSSSDFSETSSPRSPVIDLSLVARPRSSSSLGLESPRYSAATVAEDPFGDQFMPPSF